MKALVTGGAGFIGSNLVHELEGQGHDVVVLDDFFLGSRDNLAGVEEDVEIVEGDVRDRETVQACCEGVDVVFHQAARSSAPMHTEDAMEGADVNICGFLNVMTEAQERGFRVVYASTSSMYGSVEPPHREGMGEQPTNLYSASKMSRELYAHVYNTAHGVDVVGLRYFSTYGPRERSKGRYANLISQFTWKLLQGERPVIYGDGSQTRDFTFVKDVVRANLKAAESDVSGTVMNIGTGTPTTVNAMTAKLQEVLGTDIEPKHVENPIDNYVTGQEADYSRAQDLIGYEPEVGLETGIKRTVDYYRDSG